MKKYLCPACHEPTISFWQKHTLGPLRTITCAHCGAAIGVPFVRASIFVFLSVVGSSLGGVAAVLVAQPSNLASFTLALVLGSLLAGTTILWFYERNVSLVVKNA